MSSHPPYLVQRVFVAATWAWEREREFSTTNRNKGCLKGLKNMASCNTRRTLLGFADEYMTSDKDGYFTNKIGGLPVSYINPYLLHYSLFFSWNFQDWMNPSEADMPNPTCDLCNSELTLVCQMSAPLSVCPNHHRSLYLFGCPQPPCWNMQDSWICLRSQLPHKEQTPPEGNQANNSLLDMKVTDWLGEAEDWGEDDADDDPNGNYGLVIAPIDAQKDEVEQNCISFSLLTVSPDREETTGVAVAVEPALPALAEIEMEDVDCGPVSLDMPQIRNISTISQPFPRKSF